MTNDQSPSGALTGLRVIDLTRVLAGPLCTMTLGDMGADVIKVEEPTQGDDTRSWGPPFVGPLSAYYLAVNRNKRSLTLDLKNEAGRDVLRRLIAGADVVIDNFKLGTMENWGFDDEWFRANAQATIRCSITGYGSTGPKAHKPGYDFILQAESGLMSITGEPVGTPMKLGVAIVDVCAGMSAAIAVLGALQARTRTGKGQHCEVSLHDVGLQMLINVASNYLVSGQDAGRYGNSHPNIVPYRTYRAADGDLAIGVGNDRQFAALAATLGQPAWAEDPRFARNRDRVANRDLIDSEIGAAIKHRTRAEWIEVLEEAGVPVGPINSVAEALTSPQAIARNMVVDVTLGSGDPIKALGLPFQLSQTPSTIRRPPPALGADSEEILVELGLSAREIAELRDQGVV
ncbi:MAG TPA: CaiB/BaiF CoA-transferase family protein [Acidimicrobiia bacterium]